MRHDIDNVMLKRMDHEIPFTHEQEPIGTCWSGNDIFEGDSYIEFEDVMILNKDEFLADYVRTQGVLKG